MGYAEAQPILALESNVSLTLQVLAKDFKEVLTSLFLMQSYDIAPA